MSQDVQLTAEKREGLGKKAVQALRSAGKVPAMVQEHGKDSINILIEGPDMKKAFAEAGKSQPIDLKIGSAKKLVLIKEIEFVPLLPEVQHVVFQALKADEPVDADVPVHLVGEVPAEANRLVLLHTLETIAVRALPKDLPEALEVSTERLVEVDDKILISDIKVPENVELVELLANADDEEKKAEFLAQPIAIVKEPSVVESDEGVEVEEGAEGEAVEGAENGEATEGEAEASSDGTEEKNAE
jgi:large subunit ribosomal protein L25